MLPQRALRCGMHAKQSVALPSCTFLKGCALLSSRRITTTGACWLPGLGHPLAHSFWQDVVPGAALVVCVPAHSLPLLLRPLRAQAGCHVSACCRTASDQGKNIRFGEAEEDYSTGKCGVVGVGNTGKEPFPGLPPSCNHLTGAGTAFRCMAACTARPSALLPPTSCTTIYVLILFHFQLCRCVDYQGPGVPG